MWLKEPFFWQCVSDMEGNNLFYYLLPIFFKMCNTSLKLNYLQR